MNDSNLISYTNISKLLFFMYIVYEYVTSYAILALPGLATILLLGSLLAYLINNQFYFELDTSIIAFIGFTFYSLITGFFVSKNYSITVHISRNFIEYIIVAFLIINYIKDDKNANFPVNVFIFQAIFAAVFSILHGVGDDRISIATGVNVNGLGVVFSFSIAFILLRLIDIKKNAITGGVIIIFVALLLYGITLTASKKAILNALILIGLWFLFCFNKTFEDLNIWNRLLLFIVIVILYICLLKAFYTFFPERVLFLESRMGELYVGQSDQARLSLIKEGFLIFLDNPLWGVGLNNVSQYTSFHVYTHCFYSEIAASSGFLGSIIFLYGFVRPFCIFLNNIFSSKVDCYLSSCQIKYLIIIYIALFFINWSQIIFYENYLMYILSVLIGMADLINKDIFHIEIKSKYLKF